MKKEVVTNMVGEKIAYFRKERKFSQERLSRAVGLQRTSIVNIEKGRHLPSLFLIYKIAQVLKTEMSELLPSVDEIVNFDSTVNRVEQITKEHNLTIEQSESLKKLFEKTNKQKT